MSSSRPQTSFTGALAADRLRDGGRLEHEVGLRVGAPAEAAAGVELVELHLLGLEAEELGDRRLVAGLELLAVPDLAALAVELHHAVHRLQRRVREVRKLVGRLERSCSTLQCRFRVAFLARGAPGVAASFLYSARMSELLILKSSLSSHSATSASRPFFAVQ